MRLPRRLISEGKQAAGLLIVTATIGLLCGLLIVWQSYLISKIINASFLQGQIVSQLIPIFTICLVIIILRAFLTWVGELSARQAAIKIKQNLRYQLIRHLFSVGPAVLLDTEDKDSRTGELVNTAMQGIESLEAYFSLYLPQLALAALVPLTILFFIAPLDPLTAVVLLVTAPLLPLFMYLIGSAAKKQTRHQWTQLSRMSAYFLEVLQGLTTLKSLGRSREQAQLIDQVNETYRRVTMSVLRVTFLSALALEMLATLSTAVVAVEIGLRLLYGRLAFEQAFFILLLAPEFYLPLRLLGLRFHAGMAGVEAAKRIFELLDIPTVNNSFLGTPSITEPCARGHLPPTVEFKNVSFTYQDGRTGLSHVDLTIPAGKVTVLAGESGAGKSTVLSLILGFLQPQSGQILLEHVTSGEYAIQDRSREMTWVPQHPYLFQASLAANISLASPEASPREIQAAARLAHIDEFIQTLPEKYATQVGERGLRLSAGQAQRIALARAFLQGSPFLLLDEPGAHLDAQTDALLYDSLNKLTEGKTVLIISHKPPRNIHYDQVIWLAEGQVRDTCWISSQPSSSDQSHQQTVHLPEANNSPFTTEKIYARETKAVSGGTIKTLSRLLGLLRPYKLQVALSTLLGWLTIGSSMGLMSTAAYLISQAALQPSIAELQVAVVGVRFFGLARGIFRYLERLVTHDTTFKLLGNWRSWFFRSIEPLAPARTQLLHSGDLLKRAVSDVAMLEDFYVRGIAHPIVAVFTGLTACLIVAQFQPTIGWFLASMLIVSGIGLPVLILILTHRSGRTLVQAQVDVNQVVVDGIQGMPDLLVAGQAGNFLNYLVARTKTLGKIQTRLATVNGLQVSASRLLADIGMLGVLWLAILYADKGQIQPVLIGALVLLAFSSFEAFFPLPQAAQHLSASLSAASRLFEIVDSKPPITEPAQPISVPEDIHIQVRNLTFSYTKQDAEALSQIDLTLPPGHRLALVGVSGAGKSTLINLMLRFWESPPGSILVNGSDLNQYSGDGLRKRIAVLSQKPTLFTGTIYDNIRIKYPRSNHEEIIQAAQRAQIHDWILSLQENYQTWVGESGLKLSSGQRQRIALARTLVQKTPLLVLDEPTTHLDPETERSVMQGIHETVDAYHSSLLLVTHRLVNLEWMDEILVLHNGRIVERGQHTELLASRGLYYNLWSLQQE